MDDPRSLLRELKIRPSKARGQHFLVDPHVAERQVDRAQLRSQDTVLEIGPGLGVLTRRLVAAAARVIVIESDRRFAAHLRRTIPSAEVLEGDATKIAWPPFDVVVSNLPYQISSPVTFRLLRQPFDRAVLMYQWEFARRMVARPGDAEYSRLSVGVLVRADCEILERVPRNAFYPQPKVDSAVVRLRPHPPPFPIPDPAVFDQVVRALFQHRRKTVENGLRLARSSLGLSVAGIDQVLRSVPFRSRRVEDIRPEDLGILADGVARAKG